MKLLNDYKGAILIYLVITLINVIWITNYNNEDKRQVNNDNTVVMSEKINY